MTSIHTRDTGSVQGQAGFSLPELLIAVTILLIISSTVTSALLQMTNSQRTIWNRTQLHAGVRSATELLQQEVGQAGRITLPGNVTLAAAVAPLATTATVACGGVAPGCGIFVGERLIIDPGHWDQAAQIGIEETVVVSAVNGATNVITINKSIDSTGVMIQASYINAHAIGATIQVLGGFVTGIVPPNFANGSTASILKLYGDINGDGSMVYVEYTCDPIGGVPGTGNLYRNVMPFDQPPPKVAPGNSQVLLTNLQANPGGIACFTYMPNPLEVVVNSDPAIGAQSYVLDVAITLTVQTQVIDPLTKQFQTETKALLNVSPRNVFNVWRLASAQQFSRVQSMPPSVQALLP